MKNIFRIYKRDIKTIVTNWAALIMVVILLLIPSLYSLINIKASWDPYGNTSGIKVAIVNEDAGTEFKDSDINLGNQLIDKLKDNTKMGWTFVDKETATQGLLEEQYYAMIEIPSDFSKSVTTLVEKEVVKPKLIYTVNEKKNSIAPKMTDSGVKTLKGQLDDNIVKVVSGLMFRICNEVGVDVENNRPELRRIIDAVYELDENMPELEDLVYGAVDGTENISDLLDRANSMLPTVSDTMDSAEDFVNDSMEVLDKTQSDLDEASDSIRDNLILAEGVLDTSSITLRNIDENILPEAAKKNLILVSDSINATTTTIESVTKKLKGIREFINKIADIEVKEVSNISDIGSIFGKQTSDEELLDTETLTNTISQANEEESTGAETEKEESVETAGEAADSTTESDTAVEKPAEDAADGSTGDTMDGTTNGTVEGAGSSDTADGTDSEDITSGTVAGDSGITEAADEMNSISDKIKEDSEKITAVINDQIDSIKDTQKNLRKVSKKLKNIIDNLNDMYGNLNTVNKRINEEIDKLNNGEKIDIQNLTDSRKILDDVHKLVSDMIDSHDSELVPLVQEGFNYVRKISDNGVVLISQGRDILPDVENLFNQFMNISDLSNEQLVKLKDKFPDIKDKVHKLAAKLRSLDEEDQIDEILELITNNWEDQSNFLASPVEIEDNRLFPWPNYGSTATPFYTVLCLWVGGLLGSALLAVKCPPLGEDIVIRPYEMYLGKLLLFLTLGIIQAIIAILGALFLLGTYAVHPVMLMFYAIFVSIVFVCIIYTAASLFDDVGKSAIVFALVLQMAGTSGNFPIQVTPTFFQKVFPYLPFTYAISGMRQIMAGIVYPILIKDIVILSIYMIVSLVLGVLFKGIANKTTDKIVDKLLSSGILRH